MRRARKQIPCSSCFHEPGNGEWVVGLYRNEDGNAAPPLLWMDTREDRFWDAARREHVKPPAWYMRLAEQPSINPETGYAIINGAVCHCGQSSAWRAV